VARIDLGRASLVRTLVVALTLAASLNARADAYRVLHVRTLAISVDRTRVRVGEPLHLTVRAVVGDRVEALPELILPDLTAFQVLADSERLVHLDDTTSFIARLTITPNVPGRLRIGSAALDAVDARSGRAMRYRSGTIAIEALPVTPDEAARVLARAREIGVTAVAVVLACTAGLLVVLRRVAAGSAAASSAPALPVLSEAASPLPAPDTLAAWADRLRHAPTRANAVAARAELWARLGAQVTETADDVLRKTSAMAWRRAIRAAERAAFVEPAGEAAAARELAEALEALSR